MNFLRGNVSAALKGSARATRDFGRTGRREEGFYTEEERKQATE
jgi:hypothetical protein